MLQDRRGVGREVERLLRDGVEAPGGDARLLHRYLAERDEAAFEAIVDRHGPPVLALCRRYLRDPADVEDAFQATFLVLVRKGRSLRDGDALSSWLYGVAHRVAIRARADVLRRRAREGDREGVHEAAATSPKAPDDLEALDRELTRLPEKYRAPLVLCYLKGRTHDQAAAELGWPVGTVRSRMARARSLLQGRLSRLGLDASASLTMLRADLAASPLVPPSLVATTAAAARRFAGLGLLASGAAPFATSRWPAASLAQGVLSTMSTFPWKILGFAAAFGLTAGALAVVAGSPDDPAKLHEPPSNQVPPAAEKPAEKAPSDAPDGAAERRLSEVERKLDRLLGLMEKPAGSVKDVGEAVGLRPAALAPLSDPGSLREIEAQLVSAYRKSRIIDQYLGKSNDFVSDLQAQSLREDAVAPARVLVARLRELEEEAAKQEAEALKSVEFCNRTLADYAEAKKRLSERFEQAKEAVLKTGMSFEDAIATIDRRLPVMPGPGDPKDVLDQLHRARARLNGLEREDSEVRKKQEVAAPLYESKRERTAAIRRLLTWAQEHFRDVMLTIDDAAPPPK